MNSKLAIVMAVLLAFLLGGWIGDESRPKPERPVARFIGRIARLGLWLLVLGEPEHTEPQYTKTADDDNRIDHARSL